MTTQTEYILVPRELTSDMLSALLTRRLDDAASARDIYVAMLAAAPQALEQTRPSSPGAVAPLNEPIVAAIAGELARLDGYDPEDQNGGLYDLRWSGGSAPEPLGDAWSMDYLPKAERIAAAIAALQPPSGWQPIATAPKNGRTLLLGCFNEFGKWRTMRGQWCSRSTLDEEWEDGDLCEEGWYETSVEHEQSYLISPTHWMPLPNPPEAQS